LLVTVRQAQSKSVCVGSAVGFPLLQVTQTHVRQFNLHPASHTAGNGSELRDTVPQLDGEKIEYRSENCEPNDGEMRQKLSFIDICFPGTLQ
ncbi:MAG: hypothetical protein R6T85_00175, partial [Egibacteraceae bacterium]